MISIYFTILIPFIVVGIAYYFYHHKILWWEILIPIAVAIITIFVAKFTIETIATHDTEYRGYYVTEARYYEYYETYVKKTCSTTHCTGSGKTRSCYTTYYDCSYCDRNQPYWVVIDNKGSSHNITKKYYEELTKRWNVKPKFIELDRSIKYHGSCGKDGDAYSILYNGKPEDCDAIVETHSYENRIQASHNAFSLPIITEEQADSFKLYKYPELHYKGIDYRQPCILGLEKLSLNQNQIEHFERKFEYINGYYGKLNKIKLFVLLFQNQPLEISYLQEAYWDGGNDNELVICIDINPEDNKINWVKPFSWTKDKRILVDLREDIMNLQHLDLENVYNISLRLILNKWSPRDFKDFDYLTVEPSMTAIIITYLIVMIVSIGMCYYIIHNNIH
jgi:hypothetical protein